MWLVLLLGACLPSSTTAATEPGVSLQSVTAANDGCTCPAPQTTPSGACPCSHAPSCCLLPVGPQRVTGSSTGTPSGSEQSHAIWRRVEPPLRPPNLLTV